jgi:hypothetical protein
VTKTSDPIIDCKDQSVQAQNQEKEEDSPETVEGLALSLECVNDVERRNGLSLGVFSVGDRVLDDTLEEDLEDTSGLFVDQTGDTPGVVVVR